MANQPGTVPMAARLTLLLDPAAVQFRLQASIYSQVSPSQYKPTV
jgi:hypothetical protein